MPDFIDHVQDRALAEQEQREKLCRIETRGLSACVECDAAISPLRQSLGAVRCLGCQEDFEHEQARRRGGRR